MLEKEDGEEKTGEHDSWKKDGYCSDKKNESDIR